MLTDLEIAQQAKILKIKEIAKKVNLTEDDLELYGNYKAKINVDNLSKNRKDGKLVLVTAINPTPAGEGKSTTTVFTSNLFKASASPIVVVDFPSPAGVGLIAVTKTNFPSFLFLDKLSTLILAL